MLLVNVLYLMKHQLNHALINSVFCSHGFFFRQGPKLHPNYCIKSFHMSGRSLETPVDPHLYNTVRTGLVDLLGARSYFGSKVLTPYCYTLGNIRHHCCFYLVYFQKASCFFSDADVEMKLNEDGYVLPARHVDDVYKR